MREAVRVFFESDPLTVELEIDCAAFARIPVPGFQTERPDLYVTREDIRPARALARSVFFIRVQKSGERGGV